MIQETLILRQWILVANNAFPMHSTAIGSFPNAVLALFNLFHC